MAVHLNVRSSYSLLNGMMSIDDIINFTKKSGMTAVTLMDEGVLFGALDFHYAALKHEIKPLYGIEVTIQSEHAKFNIGLIALNNRGYQHLMRLSYIQSSRSLTLEDIDEFEENLVVLAFSENGPFETDLYHKNINLVTEKMIDLNARFQNLYIAFSHQESSFFANYNSILKDIALLNNIKCVAVPKVYYKKQGDEEAFRVLQAIKSSTYLDDKNLISAPNRHFIDVVEMNRLYDDECIKNTDEIARMCSVDLSLITTTLPRFETDQPVSNSVFLSSLSDYGLKRRLGGDLPIIYKERLEYELSVINSMEFTDYFLIVYDAIRFAKKEGIYVGPGRGSSAGSLVAYSLGIVDIDPIQFDLLFERFLNVDRISMPDIDIDIPDDKRQIVIDYMALKYGRNHVAHIVTFGTMKARQAFRDVARVLQVPIRKVEQVTKALNPQMELEVNYETNKKLQDLIKSDRLLMRCLDLSLKIEGLPRHTSMHAAGIVLSKLEMNDVAPTIDFSEGMNVIQYDMKHIESIGLIKIDFLGLRNLTIIDNIVAEINKVEPFDIRSIPLNDPKTFDLISLGETVGIFQLESDGMKNLLKQMKPKQFSDIVDTIALYRPGPMENIPQYLKQRENPKLIEYPHPVIEQIASSTYGILVYQEQIMQVAQKMAGFSLSKADLLRKAMSKKDIKELQSLKNDFINGVQAKGHDIELAQSLYDLIEKFANYGFNKSHSVAYGLIAYQLSYLKANYPHLFYTYLLTSVIGSEIKTRQYIDECRRRNVSLLPPNLDSSSDIYHLEGYAIRVPFTILKGFSKTVSNIIINERKDKKPYSSFYDAISRLNLVGIKKNHFEILIKGGAFDAFSLERAGMLASLDDALQYASIIKIEREGQLMLNHNLISEPVFREVPANPRVILSDELEIYGFYFSEHPTRLLKRKHVSDSIINLSVSENSYRIIVMIDRIKVHKTKNGKDMAFLAISDDTGILDCVVFPNNYDRIKEKLEVGALVLLKGHVRDEGSFIMSNYYRFEEIS